MTNAVIQLFLISTLFSQDAFTLMLTLTSTMALVPYLLVAAYGLLIARRGETYDKRPQERGRDLAISVVATLYTAFMIYAADAKLLLLSAVLYAPGTALYFWTRREQKKRVFYSIDWVIFLILVVGCFAGIYGLASGSITL